MCRKALLVGMSYRHLPHIGQLPGINDVISVGRFLLEEWKFKAENIEIMSDEAGPLNHVTILKQFRRFVDHAKRGDRLHFYFSGHGVTHPYYPQLYCGTYEEDTISAEDICEIISQIPRGSRMRLFLDCCGSGGLFDDSGKQYPHRGGRRHRLAILPRTCMAFTATPSGMAYAYSGYKRRYWNGYRSYFTQGLIRVVKRYKEMENLTMIQRIDDEIQCFFGEMTARRFKRGWTGITTIRPSLFCPASERHELLFPPTNYILGARVPKELGVKYSYWTPSNELRMIRDEIIKLKREMQELASKNEEEALAIVATPKSCLSSSNREDYGSQVSKQESMRLLFMARAYQVNGHMKAQLDPLNFANGDHVIFDNFLASGESKTGLVVCLPHGYDGQGPEHSSARLERFLQMADENPYIIFEMDPTLQKQIHECNLQIVNVTTPANFFHVLRRQIHREFRKPLIVMFPKNLLRSKACRSNVSEFDGFQESTRLLFIKLMFI